MDEEEGYESIYGTEGETTTEVEISEGRWRSCTISV